MSALPNRLFEALANELSPHDEDLSPICVQLTGLLMGASWCTGFRIERQEDPATQIVVTTTISPSVASLDALGAELNALWSGFAHAHFEATSLVTYREATILRFLTIPPDESHHVSGRIHVSGPRHDELTQGLDLPAER